MPLAVPQALRFNYCTLCQLHYCNMFNAVMLATSSYQAVFNCQVQEKPHVDGKKGSGTVQYSPVAVQQQAQVAALKVSEDRIMPMGDPRDTVAGSRALDPSSAEVAGFGAPLQSCSVTPADLEVAKDTSVDGIPLEPRDGPPETLGDCPQPDGISSLDMFRNRQSGWDNVRKQKKGTTGRLSSVT